MENMAVSIQKILITGGAGFLGHHLAEKLTAAGQEVTVFDDLSSGRLSNISALKKYRNFHFIKGSVLNAQKLEKSVKAADIVYHLAAKAIVEDVWQSPGLALETNIMGAVNVLEACRKNSRIKAVIITSSDKAYGQIAKLPYREEDSPNPGHPYDVSKLAGDLISLAYFKNYGLPVSIVRFSNIYGPADLNFSRIIPGIFRAIIKNEERPLRSDGQMIRQYLFVDDALSAYLALAQNIAKVKGEIINCGGPDILSVLEVVRKIGEILGKKIDYKILGIAKSEIKEQYLDSQKARSLLGWQPQTSFKEGIKKSFNWYEKYFS
jgi:CDP-glucose 4,6-dehydratase